MGINISQLHTTNMHNAKKLIRSICNVDYNSHTNDLFIRLKIIKFNDVYKLEVLKFMYKYINKSLPPNLQCMFTYVTDVHSRDTRNSTQKRFRPLLRGLRIHENSLLYNGPCLWNDLHKIICTCKSIYTLKKQMCKFFLTSYANQL